MLLHMNSTTSFSLKYQPLQHPCSAKTFQLPLTQRGGLVNRLQSSNKCSIKCSTQNGINNKDIITNINHKPLSKSIVPLATHDGYAAKSSDASFVDVFIGKLDAFYRLSRPHVWKSHILGMLSASLLPVTSVADVTPMFLMQVFLSMVPPLIMFIPEATINQWWDIEIDKINKPYLPLASGEFSKGEAMAFIVIFTLASLGMAVWLRSPALVIAVIVRWLVSAAYSIDLPLLRWKGNPFMAALTINIGNGFLLQIPHYIHAQKNLLGRPVVFNKTFLFTVAFMCLFNTAIAFAKDLPDVEGDTEFGVQTLPVVLGKERVFPIVVNLMLTAYGGAVLVGATSTSLLCKLVTMISHSLIGFLIWRESEKVDLNDPKSIYAYYMYMFKFYFVEFLLLLFVR